MLIICLYIKEISCAELCSSWTAHGLATAVEILKNIQDKLNNVGTIYEYVNKPDSRLAVNDKAGLLSIIHNVFDVFPLVTKRYLLLKDGLVNNVKEFKTLEEYNHYKTKTERLLSINPSSPRDN